MCVCVYLYRAYALLGAGAGKGMWYSEAWVSGNCELFIVGVEIYTWILGNSNKCC